MHKGDTIIMKKHDWVIYEISIETFRGLQVRGRLSRPRVHMLELKSSRGVKR